MMTVFQAIFFAVALGAYHLLAVALILGLLRGLLPPRRRAANTVVHPKEYIFAIRQQRRRGGVVLLLVLLLATPITVLCRQDVSNSGEVLTLEQAISLALRENHNVKSAELGVGKSGDELAATRTIRLPSMHLYTLVSQQFVKHDISVENPLSSLLPGVGPFFSVSVPRKPTTVFAGQILQPLSQQYRIGLNIEQVKLARSVEEERLHQVQQSTVDEVKRNYYGILQTQSALESVVEAIKFYRELDRVTDDYVARQVSLRSDSLEVRTRLAKAEYEALNLTNKLATEKEQLNNLLGRDVRAEFRVAAIADVNGFADDLAGLRSRALERRPEVREARLKVKQAELDRRIKKSEYIPDVSVGFTYVTLRNFDDTIPKQFASLGVVMKWEVFDWGRKRDQLAEKDKTIGQAKNGLHETESQVLIDVGDKFRKFQQTRQALVVAQLSQENAREGLRVNTNKYRLTAALLSDVLQSQASLAEANHSYQQAILGYWTAKAELEKAVGEGN
ncbi:MAG TPA: TolC family protein [Blastocatellia bacterium]